jgi:hypothetical protein
MKLNIKTLLFSFFASVTVVFSADMPEIPTNSAVSIPDAGLPLCTDSASGLVVTDGVILSGHISITNWDMNFDVDSKPDVYRQWCFAERMWRQSTYSNLLKVPGVFIGKDNFGIAPNALYFMFDTEYRLRLGSVGILELRPEGVFLGSAFGESSFPDQYYVWNGESLAMPLKILGDDELPRYGNELEIIRVKEGVITFHSFKTRA